MWWHGAKKRDTCLILYLSPCRFNTTAKKFYFSTQQISFSTLYGWAYRRRRLIHKRYSIFFMHKVDDGEKTKSRPPHQGWGTIWGSKMSQPKFRVSKFRVSKFWVKYTQSQNSLVIKCWDQHLSPYPIQFMKFVMRHLSKIQKQLFLKNHKTF